MPKYAPDGYAYYAVATPSIFRERLLPIDETTWTAEQKDQWEDLYELSELHGTIVHQTNFQRG